MNNAQRIVWCVLLAWLCCADVHAKTIHHYVFFGMDREKLKDAKSFLETPAFEGAQVAYSWRQLEQGKDNYDFSMIREDLAFLEAHGKKLWIQIQIGRAACRERVVVGDAADCLKKNA